MNRSTGYLICGALVTVGLVAYKIADMPVMNEIGQVIMVAGALGFSALILVDAWQLWSGRVEGILRGRLGPLEEPDKPVDQEPIFRPSQLEPDLEATIRARPPLDGESYVWHCRRCGAYNPEEEADCLRCQGERPTIAHWLKLDAISQEERARMNLRRGSGWVERDRGNGRPV